jgi:excisionase family DNA binding protein
MRQLITLKEAADRLGVHVSTVRSWVRSGRVPAFRCGRRFVRVDWATILAALEVAQKDPSDGVRR